MNIPILCKVYHYGANFIVYASSIFVLTRMELQHSKVYPSLHQLAHVDLRFATEMLSEQLIRHGCID